MPAAITAHNVSPDRHSSNVQPTQKIVAATRRHLGRKNLRSASFKVNILFLWFFLNKSLYLVILLLDMLVITKLEFLFQNCNNYFSLDELTGLIMPLCFMFLERTLSIENISWQTSLQNH